MQRTFELAAASEISIQHPSGFQCIRHAGIGVRGIRLGPLAADVDRDDGIELSGVFNRLDVAELQAGRGIDGAPDAGAVVHLDALEVSVDQLCRSQLPRQDCAVHVGNGGLFDLKCPSLSRVRSRRQQSQDRRRVDNARPFP
jgi:hypothetical protein